MQYSVPCPYSLSRFAFREHKKEAGETLLLTIVLIVLFRINYSCVVTEPCGKLNVFRLVHGAGRVLRLFCFSFFAHNYIPVFGFPELLPFD